MASVVLFCRAMVHAWMNVTSGRTWLRVRLLSSGNFDASCATGAGLIHLKAEFHTHDRALLLQIETEPVGTSVNAQA
jgi:hypothetical protein